MARTGDEQSLTLHVEKVLKGLTLAVDVKGMEKFRAQMETFAKVVCAAAEGLPMGVEVIINGPERKKRCRPGLDGAPPVAYDVDDPEFAYEVGSRLKVMLDGKEVESPSAYDVEAGWVEHWPNRNNPMTRTRSTGNVTVAWK